MAISLDIYSNGNTTTKSINIDFACEVLASSFDTGYDSEQKYFFKITSSAKDVNGSNFPVKLVDSLGDLALNGTKQAASNTNAAYTSITAMINDYVYDMINGHAENKFSSGVTAFGVMDFSQ